MLIAKEKSKSVMIEVLECSLYRLQESWGKVIVIIFVLYGLGILYKGVVAGVYLTDDDSVGFYLVKLLMWAKSVEAFKPPNDAGYTVSFFASAEQDYWFFLVMGLAVSIPTLKSPRTDGIRAKIKHFFPTLSESSPYMAELMEMMNEASCICVNFKT
jgi:hypothetical protein